MHFYDTLAEKHPIRKTKAQKEEFRLWFAAEAEKLGYQAQVERKGSSNNVVVGDPENAKVIFTAHYDTPPVMPFPNLITPMNISFFLLYHFGISMVMILLAAVVSYLVGGPLDHPELRLPAAWIVCLLLLWLLMFGPANRSCSNDNTSGVTAVMEIMSRLPEDQRGKTAFILFDNEEKGLLGSSSYAGKHKQVKKHTLLINLDCVGDGEHIFFFANKKTRALPEYALLCDALSQQEGRQLHMEKMESAVYPSDQANFKLGIAVCACNKKKGLGYYVDKIHTAKDTVCEQTNMGYLGKGLSCFVEKLEG